ncbi:unnamed protein product [Effrenium voratum]|uniref:Ankyrin repeat domain-containing protein n=1 Tax=Effrenium voratum TaxID=2562239 RepID=A0AA36N532_9DINO|nr:unnamed protein product [Effrenium voratum]CAJ1431231.1 unnamed protein product [Effrenium voratum]
MAPSVAPGRGLALRERLALQADLALTEPENPLRRLMEAPSGSREEDKQRLEEAEQLLLQRPPAPAIEDKPMHEEPMNLAKLHQAAMDGDLQAMARMDLRLQGALEEDETLRSLAGKDFKDPKAQAALQLYQDSLALGKVGGDIDKQGFQAVMRDDAETLRQLLGRGLDVEAQNGGGHTLLQLARERGKELCAEVLIREGAKP